ncbi:MAG: hypothetical protein AB2374_11465 [Cytobacillus gottheilii]|uniref:hypothetical protein n=1 Tax=Cytobacillus gottheilii TaxID=859144 RepID=UPI000AA59B2D|nr:hypothetical protein [Cytobacillus gottheilii]
MIYEWIVVGGGIQGCTIAAFLMKNNKVSASQLLIIDPMKHRYTVGPRQQK